MGPPVTFPVDSQGNKTVLFAAFFHALTGVDCFVDIYLEYGVP